MKKIIAFKAENGRLFESEQKCLAYEEVLRAYPKVDEAIEYGTCTEGQPLNVKILTFDRVAKHTITTQRAPRARKVKEVFFVIDGKYKMYDDFGLYEKTVMHDVMGEPFARKPYIDYTFTAKFVAQKLLQGVPLKQAVSEVAQAFHENNDHSKVVCYAGGNEGEWVLEDERWKSGHCRGNRLHIIPIK